MKARREKQAVVQTSALSSNGSAARILAKTVVLSAVSILMIRNSCHWLGTVVGVVMQGVAMSWLYMVGLDCAGGVFFRGALNDVIGTVALAPLLRPLGVLRESGSEGRALVYRLVTSLVGTSVSHLAVDAFVLVAVPWLYMKQGWMGLLKYWLLPLLFAHLNAGSLLTHKPAGAFLFPEIGESATAPLYALEQWMTTALPRLGEASWQSPLWSATREWLLWRRRDWLLHAALLAAGILSLVSMTQAWAPALPLLLVPFLAWQSAAAHALAAAREKTALKLSSAKVFTREELWQRPDLAAVDDIVFDLVRLSETHPGGSQIRACGGTDVTGLFGSMHALTAKRNLKVLLDYQVGTLKMEKDAIRFQFDSDFAQDVRAAIVKAMEGVDFYAPVGWWLRTAAIMTLTLVCEYLWVVQGRWYVAVCVGVLHAIIGICVQHDGSHGAVSKKPWVNALVAYGADWIGSNRWLWFQQHIVGHHPHCNIEDADPDAHSAEPLLQFHWLGEGKIVQGIRGWLLAHQAWYMYLVLPWYGPTVIYNMAQLVTMDHGGEVPASSWLMAKRPLAVLTRFMYILRIVALPVIFSGVSWPMALLGVPLVTGFVLTFVFLVSHNFEGSDRSPLAPAGEKTDFYRLQVETSCSYGHNMAMFFSGGLNMQIEHHIMPRLNSWHYPRIQPALRAVCAKHGVRYAHFPTLWDNVVSCVAYMQAAGKHASSGTETASKALLADATTTPQSISSAEPLHIILKGKLVDVTRWAERHPGGPEVVRVFKNRDATEQFLAMHSAEATRKMNIMAQSAPAAPADMLAEPTPAAKAYAALRAELVAEGQFESDKASESWLLVSNLSWYVAGLLVMRYTTWSWTGAMLWAWGMQQSGWLSHDYLHHGVLSSVKVNDWVGGALGWLQGYDSDWWKHRHNLHHVATNEEGNDPDIDLAPLLTFVNQHASLNVVQKFQHMYFIPLLSLLHFSWLFSSFRFTVERRRWMRMAALMAYHYLVWAFVYRSPAGVALWGPLVGSYLMKGAMTALFVFSTHYPEVRLPPGASKLSLLEQTAITSRNIGGGSIVDWMSGGISRQIEHHLFPMLPRSRLVALAPRVQKMFRQLGIEYHETSVWDCMKSNVECLLWKRKIGVDDRK